MNSILAIKKWIVPLSDKQTRIVFPRTYGNLLDHIYLLCKIYIVSYDGSIYRRPGWCSVAIRKISIMLKIHSIRQSCIVSDCIVRYIFLCVSDVQRTHILCHQQIYHKFRIRQTARVRAYFETFLTVRNYKQRICLKCSHDSHAIDTIRYDTFINLISRIKQSLIIHAPFIFLHALCCFCCFPFFIHFALSSIWGVYDVHDMRKRIRQFVTQFSPHVCIFFIIFYVTF